MYILFYITRSWNLIKIWPFEKVEIIKHKANIFINSYVTNFQLSAPYFLVQTSDKYKINIFYILQMFIFQCASLSVDLIFFVFFLKFY